MTKHMDDDDDDVYDDYDEDLDLVDESEDHYEEAKLLKSDGNLEEAKALLESVVKEEAPKSLLGFRALKQLFKISIEQGHYDEALLLYHQVLDYATFSSSVPRSKIDNVIGRIIRPVAEPNGAQFDADLHEAIEELHGRFKDENGADMPDKATQLWDIYALHMRLVRRRGHDGRLEVLCNSVMQLKGNTTRPETTAFVKEFSAQVHFGKGRYAKAYFDFFEAFTNYEHAGRAENVKCLAYTILVSVLAKTPAVPLGIFMNKANEAHPLVAGALKLIDAHRNGGYAEMKAAFDVCDESLRSDEFVSQFIGVCRTRHVTAKVPAEMWKDVFQPLNRCHLDACGIVGRSWRRLADSPVAPARHFEYVAFLPPKAELTTFLASAQERWREHNYIVTDDARHTDSPLTFVWHGAETRTTSGAAAVFLPIEPRQPGPFDYHNRALPQRTDDRVTPRDLSRDAPLAELLHFLSAVTRYSFIEHFYLAGPMSEQLLPSLLPQFFSDVAIKTVVNGTPEAVPSAADAAVFRRFFLSFERTPNLVVTSRVNEAFVTDDFMAECTARGVNEIRLPPENPERDENVPTYPLSSDAIFNFCFSGGSCGGRRTFNAWGCRLSPDFVDRVVQDSHNLATEDLVELRFCVARESPTDRALQDYLENHRDKLVTCVRNIHGWTADKEVYRWTTTPQLLLIQTSLRDRMDRKRFYYVQRGGQVTPQFQPCNCTVRTENFFNQ